MHTPALILLRGLPGSGKSSLAQLLSEKGRYPIVSIDDYFTDSNGNYHFRFEENHLAYSKCEENTLKFVKLNKEKIFIDNTFTMDWEMEPYFKMASEFGYFIFVVTVENRGGYKNLHEVTKEQLQRMAEKYKVVLI
jgi:predicted kinase